MFIRLMAAAAGAGAIFVVAGALASDNGDLQEIVVTAQRRAESAQDVGIAMSVLSGQSLAEKSISYVNDLQNVVPSLQIEPAFGSSQPQFRLRGVGFIDYTSNNASPVGVRRWDQDLLGDGILPPASSALISIDDRTGYSRFDLKAVFDDGTTHIRRDVNVCDVERYAISYR